MLYKLKVTMSTISELFGFESPFGEDSLFLDASPGSYITKDIDFVKLAEVIAKGRNLLYNHSRFIGRKKIAVQRTLSGGIDSKFDRIIGNLATKTKIIKTEIPIFDESSNSSRALDLNGRLNTKAGVVELRSQNGKIGGLEMILDLEKREIDFYFHLYFQGKRKISMLDDDGTHIAISIGSSSFKDFDLLEEHLGKNFLTAGFKADIEEQFEIAFKEANDDYDSISWLYEVAPLFVTSQRGNGKLYKDFLIILEGLSELFSNAPGIDQNRALINVLSAMDEEFLYYKFKENQAILFAIIDKLDSSFDLPFVALLTDLCYQFWNFNFIKWPKSTFLIRTFGMEHARISM